MVTGFIVYYMSNNILLLFLQKWDFIVLKLEVHISGFNNYFQF